MSKKICGKCGKEIKRGEEWMEAIGIRFHMSCALGKVKKPKKGTKNEKTK